MQVLHLKSPVTPLAPADRAVALGLFDGVHLGHRRVIMNAVGAENLRAAVFSFGADAAALKPNACALCTPAQTERLFASLGVDEWLQADFSGYRDLSAQAFVKEVLCRQLHAKRVCCGFNFRFGKGGAGDVARLRALCAENGIELVVVQEVCADGQAVSSDRIRRLIEQGEVQKAARLLGHPFSLELPVSHGQQLGRQLGSPTVNQCLPDGFVLPRFGVYAGTVVIDDRTYFGISNVGIRPTVGASKPLCETWIEDFEGDLYDRTLSVVLTSFERPERPFACVQALKDQIVADRNRARDRRKQDRIRAVFFDFDDTLQDRRTAFLQYADFFLSRYLPHLSEQQRAEKRAEMLELNRGGYVDYTAFFTEMPKAMGLENPPDSAALFAEYQRQFPRYATLFPDAVEVLQTLRKQGFLLGIVTNGPTVQQHRKIDFAGIRPLLDTVVVSMEEGVHKPNPELFCRAAARLGLSAHQCVFVGDHPVNDIEGALQSGMHPVFMDTREKSCGHSQVPVIHTLRELPALLNGKDWFL